jgi:hypothetical protein
MKTIVVAALLSVVSVYAEAQTPQSGFPSNFVFNPCPSEKIPVVQDNNIYICKDAHELQETPPCASDSYAVLYQNTFPICRKIDWDISTSTGSDLQPQPGPNQEFTPSDYYYSGYSSLYPYRAFYCQRAENRGAPCYHFFTMTPASAPLPDDQRKCRWIDPEGNGIKSAYVWDSRWEGDHPSPHRICYLSDRGPPVSIGNLHLENDEK